MANGYDWHSLIGCSTRGVRALERYRQQESAPVFVLPDVGVGNRACGFRCERQPDFENLYFDVLIVPEDFSWTMAFTHEDNTGQCGPYFAVATNGAP